MRHIRTALIRLAADHPSIRGHVVPLTRQADKWKSMPKGWTDDSRKKFWDTLTGDNKHKVTKCIKEMEGKGGIDNPGAFCASLADRVLGPEWRKGPRKKKAADAALLALLEEHAKHVSALSSKARSVTIVNHYFNNYARLLGLSLRAMQRGIPMRTPFDEALTHWWSGASDSPGSHTFQEVVDQYGDRKMQQQAAELFAQLGVRQTWVRAANGDMLQYFADNPDKLAEKQERDKKMADQKFSFNKYNAPEVMGQLMTLLKKNDLDETVDLLQQHKIPQAVDKAWKGRDKRASRLAFLRQRQKTAADIRKLLSQMFAGHQQYVKNWSSFLRELASDIPLWVDQWSTGYVLDSAHVVSTSSMSWQGDQISGGWDEPPDYAEAEVEVAENIEATVSATLDLRKFSQEFTKTYKSYASDARGFMQATSDLLGNKPFLTMFGKLLVSGVMSDIKENYDHDTSIMELFEEEISDEAGDATESGWTVSYGIKKVKFGRRPNFKVTGSGIRVWLTGTVTVDPGDPEPPENDGYDGPDDDYYDGRYASRLAELRAQRNQA